MTFEDRDRVESLKALFKPSRWEEINPTPFQSYQNDPGLGRRGPSLAYDSPSYGWIDDVTIAVTRSLVQVITRIRRYD